MTDKKKYSDSYSDVSFWDKIKTPAGKAGKHVVITALTLYFTASDRDTPLWARTVILGALGYFIIPIDAIPDPTPIIGYADDIAVMLKATTIVAFHIKPDHKARAHDTWKSWFG